MTDARQVMVTDEHERIARDLLVNIRGLSFDSQVGTVAALLALALAEERARAEAPLLAKLEQVQVLLDDAQADHARIAELEAKVALKEDDCERYRRIRAELEAESARLAKRLAVYRGAIRQTTGGAS